MTHVIYTVVFEIESTDNDTVHEAQLATLDIKLESIDATNWDLVTIEEVE